MKNIKNKEKNSELRKQIADVLKYLRRGVKGTPWIYKRNTKNSTFDTIYTEYISASNFYAILGECLKRAKNMGIDQKDIYISLDYEYEHKGPDDDYDESNYCFFNLDYQERHSDEEYFEELCSYILPSEYQLTQYLEYKRLKNMFESQ